MPSVVLLPGLLCDSQLWASQTKALDNFAAFYHYDIRAFDTIRKMAKAVLSQAPERFYMAGFSMGGYIAMDIMELAPQRVEKLALLSTTARSLPPEVNKHLVSSIKEIESEGFDDYLNKAFPLYVYKKRTNDINLKTRYISMAKSLGPEVAIHQIRALSSFTDHREKLKEIKCPTLIICGDSDKRSPVLFHEEMESLIPNSKLTIIERSGHFTPLEKPDQVTLEFYKWLSE